MVVDAGTDASTAEDGGPVDAALETDAALADSGPPAQLRVLVFSRTTAFRHDSITDGVAALRALATDRGWVLDATEDATRISASGLAEVDALVFLSTTGDPLDAAQEAALEAYVRGGGGWVGVHAAADCEYDWPFYGELVGAWFARHPAIQPATLRVEDRGHPATAHLDPTWMRTDEWYDFRSNPRVDVRVLMTIDEATYDGGGMGDDHPMTWAHDVGAGRSFYTALGHTAESYAEPAFRALLGGAIEWAGGR
ncbi:MAG: ThuA domain-containing protein [Sandaracinaceae bacterium]|nr:ThuA domain-containing protein [Sandaracinaceae bacterium]